jgi:uncharacterized protein
MTVSMYKVSVPIFVQFLTAQSECIDKAVAHIEAKQLDPNFFLNMRLFPDMYPYVRQVQQASTHAASKIPQGRAPWPCIPLTRNSRSSYCLA